MPTKTTDLPIADTPLTGTEIVYVVQDDNSRQTTVEELRPVIATEAEAEAGTANDVVMTPLTTRQAFNADGDAPVYACRAWVNFNGTGTVAIRASGNVSSITDNGTGNYTINFTTAMQDANYCATTASTLNATVMGVACPVEYLAGSVRIITSGSGSGNVLSATLADHLNVNVAIFR